MNVNIHSRTMLLPNEDQTEKQKCFLSPALTNGIPSKGTYCDFHMSLVEALAGLGDCLVPQKLLVCCLWRVKIRSRSTSLETYPR